MQLISTQFDASNKSVHFVTRKRNVFLINTDAYSRWRGSFFIDTPIPSIHPCHHHPRLWKQIVRRTKTDDSRILLWKLGWGYKGRASVAQSSLLAVGLSRELDLRMSAASVTPCTFSYTGPRSWGCVLSYTHQLHTKLHTELPFHDSMEKS